MFALILSILVGLCLTFIFVVIVTFVISILPIIFIVGTFLVSCIFVWILIKVIQAMRELEEQENNRNL